MSEHSEDLDKIIKKETLLNAQLHEGNPQQKPIMGKVLGKNPQFRSQAKEVAKKIAEEVERIKSLSAEEIQQRLNELAPNAIDEYEAKQERKAEKRREQKKSLTELPNVIKGKFKVRYAPDPSKYPHLGQGINYLINRIFADKYDGEVVLRFDDTNPYIVKPEYYDAIKDGLTWLGANWDQEVRASAYIEEFYDTAIKMLENGKFYVCFCDGETKSELAEAGEACEHRQHSVEENLEFFKEMQDGKYEPGEAIVRLMGDMSSDNNVMRDPIMLRLVDKQHPMLDKMYFVFPTYDFESSYFEANLGITHVIRSGEFGSMRQELQSKLIREFGGDVPEFVSFGRVNIQGCPTKGRVIRQLVEENVVNGWDDIRLITLQGLKHRGIHPKTPRLIVQEAGLSPQNTQIAWTTIEARSRQLLEPESKRFFFVEDPVKIKVQGEIPDHITYPYHPDHPDWGKREFNLTEEFYLAKKDVSELELNQTFRLKDLYNVKLIEKQDDYYVAEAVGNKIISDIEKIQWVNQDYIEGEMRVPLTLEDNKGNIREKSMYTISGYFEKNISTINDDEIVQLERVGFAKLSFDDTISGHIVHLY